MVGWTTMNYALWKLCIRKWWKIVALYRLENATKVIATITHLWYWWYNDAKYPLTMIITYILINN